ARAHQAAGRVLGVGQQRDHLAPRLGIDQLEQAGASLLVGLLQHVGGVVGRELANPELALGARQRRQQRGLLAGIETLEEVARLLRIEDAEALDALGRVERGPRVRELLGGERLVAAVRLGRAHTAPVLLASARRASMAVCSSPCRIDPPRSRATRYPSVARRRGCRSPRAGGAPRRRAKRRLVSRSQTAKTLGFPALLA